MCDTLLLSNNLFYALLTFTKLSDLWMRQKLCIFRKSPNLYESDLDLLPPIRHDILSTFYYTDSILNKRGNTLTGALTKSKKHEGDKDFNLW